MAHLPQPSLPLADLLTALVRRLAAPDGASCFSTCIDGLRRSSWQEVAWQSSGLMGDGGPVELVFSTGDPDLRCTIDFAGPEIDEHARLAAACRVVSLLGLRPLQPDWIDAMAAMQARGPLRWGTWLGLRHGRGVVRAKIYVEVPDEAAQDRCLGARPLLPGCDLRMIGNEAGRGRVEHYWGMPDAGRRDLECLLASCVPQAIADAYLDTLRDIVGIPVEAALRFLALGYSTTKAPDGNSEFALFFRTRGVPGGTATILDAFLRRDRHISPLARLLEWFGGALPRSGMVTLSPGMSGKIGIRIGISGTEAVRLVGAVA